MRRSLSRLSGGHGGKSTTWATSKGNPGQQYAVLYGFMLTFGGCVLYGWNRMQAEAARLKASKHHDGDHEAHH